MKWAEHKENHPQAEKNSTIEGTFRSCVWTEKKLTWEIVWYLVCEMVQRFVLFSSFFLVYFRQYSCHLQFITVPLHVAFGLKRIFACIVVLASTVLARNVDMSYYCCWNQVEHIIFQLYQLNSKSASLLRISIRAVLFMFTDWLTMLIFIMRAPYHW